jgi:hypothetical protein
VGHIRPGQDADPLGIAYFRNGTVGEIVIDIGGIIEITVPIEVEVKSEIVGTGGVGLDKNGNARKVLEISDVLQKLTRSQWCEGSEFVVIVDVEGTG